MNNEEGAILFVDDEENILKSIRRSLIDEPYAMYFADSGKKALEILENEDISVIVTDMRMPEMNGLELLEIVKEKYPDVVRIVLTGYAQVSTLLAAINSGQIYRYLVKPWKLEEDFKPALKQALEYHRLVAERNRMLKELKAKTEELENQVREKEKLLKKIEETNEVRKEVFNILTAQIIPFVKESIIMVEKISKSNLSKIDKEISTELSNLRKRANYVLDLLNRVKDIF